jgi:hypothetical protein
MKTKYELVKETQIDGRIWYHITKDGIHVNETYTQNLEEVTEQFDKIVQGYLPETKTEILKTLEINDKNDN